MGYVFTLFHSSVSDTGLNPVFYIVAIMVLPLCVPAFMILPSGKGGQKDRKLDVPGVGTLTVGLILFVYAISDGSNTGQCLLHTLGTSH